MSDEPLRIELAQILAFEQHYVRPGAWRYDGTHAAGNEMLRTVDIILGALRRKGLLARPSTGQERSE